MNTMVNADVFTTAVELSRSNRRSALKMIEELDAARHLVRATVMACDSIEDIGSRNGFVALLAEIETKVHTTAQRIRDEFVDVVSFDPVA